MAKASKRRTHRHLSVWQQLIYLYKKYSPSSSGNEVAPWLMGFLTFALMLLWNWKLWLSTGAGVGIMLLIYLIPGSNWRVYWASWQKFLTGSSRKLTFAVGGGAIAAFGTYLSASIWADSENSWLATGSIIQGFLSVFTFVLLIWHIVKTRGTDKNQAHFEQFLLDLASKEPLKRLLAVRQLTCLVKPSQEIQLGEYFRLMLAHEGEPIIREALLQSLQRLDQNQFISQENQPLRVPIRFSKMEKPTYHLED